MDCLSCGTKIVPHDQLCDYDYHTVMNQDLRNVIARCFCKVVGFWPIYNLVSSFHQFFVEIISQCPCNHIFLSFMHTIMSDYDNFANPLLLDHTNLKRGLVSMIPEGCVLTVCDKGLGPVLLPYDWFVREYKHQAVLGGHELVLSSEGALLVKLFSIIADFRCSLNDLEGSLFKSIYKYLGNIARIFINRLKQSTF